MASYASDQIFAGRLGMYAQTLSSFGAKTVSGDKLCSEGFGWGQR